MKLLHRFSTKEVDDFARALARDLSRRYPPEMENDTKAASLRKLAVTVEELYGRAANFRRDKKLGVYRKAKLGNIFRWELKAIGYSEAFVDRLTTGLVVHIAQKGKR